MSAADLRDPAVLVHLRGRVAAFVLNATAAIDGSAQQVSHVTDWLRHEQLPHWKRTLNTREEAYQQARRTWLSAEADVQLAAQSRGPGRPSSLEEKLDMDKAKRKRDEAEERLASIRRWLDQVERLGAPLVTTLRGHGFALSDDGAKALARLDGMVTAIDDYHRAGRSA